MVLLIIGFCLICINIFIFFNYKNKMQNIYKLKDKIKSLNTKQENLSNKLNKLNKELLNNQKISEGLISQRKTLEKQIEIVNEKYKNIKLQTEINLQKEQDKIKKEYQQLKNKKALFQKEQTQIKNKINQLQHTYQTMTAVLLQEKEKEEKQQFYKIQISQNDIQDIKKLQQWKKSLNDSSIVSKLIWSSYIIKPASNMCNRILGLSQTCGIYKITNIKTKQVYIGQSVNISDRFKNHIKCGLGINASSTNKLYNSMQQYGVWNFTFELLQKCSREQLNEKERFWINTYSSDRVGLNITKGNK